MFVVFEGIDGSGKTTVSNLVVQRLQDRGLSVKHLRAEGKFVSSVSEAIRSLARDSRNVDLDPRSEFLLYVARDVQLIEEALREALRTHDVVLADRFLYTAEVLGRYGRGLPMEYTKPILEAAAGGLSPDLVVLIDVDPVLARARRKSSKLITKDTRPPSRKGLAGVGLQHRVRRGYLERAAEEPERWFVATNEDVLEDTVSRVSNLIELATAQGARVALDKARREVAAAKKPATTQAMESADEALLALEQWVTARADREPHVAAYLLDELFGARIDGLRRTLAERAPTVVLAGLKGLTDEVSWELRERLVEKHPAAVALSLRGVPGDDPRVRLLEQRLESRSPVELALALVQRDDELAWDLRDRLYEAYPDPVIESLAGVRSERALALRTRWFEAHRRQVSESYTRALSAARSVESIDDALAWEIREAARTAAPIASLGSLGELSCDRSFEVRERALRRATKVVMQTLRNLRDDRAYRMRWEVAGEVKEAIDSIDALDDEQAWSLRETYQDVWPSTVLKTLGALVETSRGEALLRRQLAKHPHNVSLLKHAAAYALGTHRAGAGLELSA
ncbi:MAG: dTMP kinase [Polyangiales bacterium]